MDNEYITPETLGGEDLNNEFASAPVKETVSAVSSNTADALSLNELNSYLGKNFTSKESALKSLKDTFSYVGKKTEDITPKIDPNQFISREQYEQDMFYSRNAEYSTPEVREVIDAMAKAKGLSPKDVVASDTFKAVFSKVKGYDESQSLKSVLETNPRLASTRDSYTKAAEMLNQGGRKDEAEGMIARAVLDSLK
jgi:hypothetical protein